MPRPRRIRGLLRAAWYIAVALAAVVVIGAAALADAAGPFNGYDVLTAAAAAAAVGYVTTVAVGLRARRARR